MAFIDVRNARELGEACARVQPGDTILVHGGIYDKPGRLADKHGEPGRPITIRAADAVWIDGDRKPSPDDGRTDPAKSAPHSPSPGDGAFLVIDRCSRIVVEGLRVRHWWPVIVYLNQSRRVTVRDCDCRHGRFAIFARGDRTQLLLMEDNRWQQDDSREHLLWTTIDWARAHGNENSDGQYRYYNGAFFGSKGIRGQVVIRGNRISDAYNGVRMKADDDPIPPHDMPRINADVHIVDNDFLRIRDNPIEPECSAFNWHVRYNRLVDCHAWFSMDGTEGGYWYIYGNTGRFQTRLGEPASSHHTMGRVLKLSYELQPPNSAASKRVPIYPWYVFNNSWHLRCPVIGGAAAVPSSSGPGPDFTAHLNFFNNAFTWCDPAVDGPWICECIPLVKHYDHDRSHGANFDYDICDQPSFMDFFRRAHRGEDNGIVSTRPIFTDARSGDFSLGIDSEARSSARLGAVERAGLAAAPIQPQVDGSLNRGAQQAYGVVQVPELEAQTAALIATMMT